jgi:hypothetical protein
VTFLAAGALPGAAERCEGAPFYLEFWGAVSVLNETEAWSGEHMLGKLLNAVFGCWHLRYSFPMTIRPGSGRRKASVTGTYVVCLECGKELPYDWNEMKIADAAEERTSLATSVAAKRVA